VGIALLGASLGLFGIARIYRRQQDANSRPYEARNDGRWAVATAVVLIFGWLACIYGAILLMTGFDDLASLDRRSGDIRVLAVVIAELELGNIERAMFFAEVVEGPDPPRNRAGKARWLIERLMRPPTGPLSAMRRAVHVTLLLARLARPLPPKP
jgi:hypothetical protein